MNLKNAEAASRTVTSPKQVAFVLIRDELTPSIRRKALDADQFDRVVRRPYGITIKPDTYAFIELFREDPRGGAPIALFNENYPTGLFDLGAKGGPLAEYGRGAYAPYTNNFIIRTFSERREEKYQLIETFGDNFLFLFGERPRIVSVSGTLMNTLSHQWKKEWLLNYDRYLRGTKAVESRAVAVLHLDNVSISGYIINTSVDQSADSPYAVNFSFQMVVVDYHFDPDFNANKSEREIRSGGVAEGEPRDTVTYFGDRIRSYAAYRKATVRQSGDEFDDLLGEVVEYVRTGQRFIQRVMNHAYVSSAINIADALRRDGIAGLLSSSLAAAYTIYLHERNVGIDTLYTDPVFADGVGGLVEYKGKPIELYRVGRSPFTLQQIGANLLLANVDNSLSVLLNLRSSPVIRSMALVWKVVDAALSAVGIETNFYGGLLSGAGTVDTLLTRAVGTDMPAPILTFERKTVGPELDLKLDVNSNSWSDVIGSGNAPQGITAVPLPRNLTPEAFKATENYQALPRAWRLRVETDWDNIKDKLLFLAEQGFPDPVILIRDRGQLSGIPTNVSDELGA